jgi:hypothetical protein
VHWGPNFMERSQQIAQLVATGCGFSCAAVNATSVACEPTSGTVQKMNQTRGELV